MTGPRRYIVDDWLEHYRRGRSGRREFLRRLAAFAGSAVVGVGELDRTAPFALTANNPTVTSTSIESNNNLLVNGKPFLVIQGEGLDYNSWHQSGYTETTADQ